MASSVAALAAQPIPGCSIGLSTPALLLLVMDHVLPSLVLPWFLGAD
jgi:hypothetical protein